METTKMEKNKKLICPQCQEKKVLLDLIYHDLKGNFKEVSMCKECYDALKYKKREVGKGFPRVLYRKTTMM